MEKTNTQEEKIIKNGEKLGIYIIIYTRERVFWESVQIEQNFLLKIGFKVFCLAEKKKKKKKNKKKLKKMKKVEKVDSKQLDLNFFS